MELTRILNSPSFTQWIAESLALFFLIGGVAVLAVGLGLFFNGGGTLRAFEKLNRWVSLRRATRPLEILRDTRPTVQKYRRWLAAIFVAGGAYALYGLATHFDAAAIIFSLRLNFLRADFASWLVDSTRWVLIAGNLTAIAIGFALAFAPAFVEAIESAGSRWFSERQLTKGSDDLRLPLDQRVAENPRVSGLIIAFFGLVLIGAFTLMLFGVR
jgi:hypothetical protein